MIKFLLFAMFSLASAQVCAASQPISSQKCPTIEIKATEASVNAGGTVTLTVKVTNPEPNIDYTYNWSLSSGGITEGQGTAKVIVELESDPMTATVNLGGGSPTCSNVASITITPKGKASSSSALAVAPNFRQVAALVPRWTF